MPSSWPAWRPDCARYGVEARHLRLHKHAAEREAGFIEQIVLPLLKQRNPEARQRAHENVAELSAWARGCGRCSCAPRCATSSAGDRARRVTERGG